ncbi:PilW family protein [Victivallis vadensis]|uniref:PilW family protein n=1 Tax=Victivallis vadensis TaxID=172901 RepID=UPI0026DC376A|nr:type II secretion system protein [Victivallis vadensis]
MKYYGRKKFFTLVELLVAMSVFSILLVLMMQFFSGSQKLWVNTEQKTNLYSDARIAMDLMSTLLQNTFYATGGVPFLIKNGTTENAQIYFPTQTKMDLIDDVGEVVFVSFQRGPSSGTGTDASDPDKKNRSNELLMLIFADNDDDHGSRYDFSFFFPPYSSETMQFADAADNLKTTMDQKLSLKENGNCSVLLNNVTAFSLLPMVIDTSNDSQMKPETGSTFKRIPYVIEIRLSLMDQKNYDFWDKQLKGRDSNLTSAEKKRADEFRLQHEYTFTRAVYLSDRWNREL